MGYLESKNGEFTLNGIVLEKEIQCNIKALSFIWGTESKETCDRINQVLQVFLDVWAIMECILKTFMMIESIRNIAENIEYLKKYRPT